MKTKLRNVGITALQLLGAGAKLAVARAREALMLTTVYCGNCKNTAKTSAEALRRGWHHVGSLGTDRAGAPVKKHLWFCAPCVHEHGLRPN